MITKYKQKYSRVIINIEYQCTTLTLQMFTKTWKCLSMYRNGYRMFPWRNVLWPDLKSLGWSHKEAKGRRDTTKVSAFCMYTVIAQSRYDTFNIIIIIILFLLLLLY